MTGQETIIFRTVTLLIVLFSSVSLAECRPTVQEQCPAVAMQIAAAPVAKRAQILFNSYDIYGERTTRVPIFVKIDAVDNFGGHGTWCDSGGRRSPYPFDAEKLTTYVHTVNYEPGLVITGFAEVILLAGNLGDQIQCAVWQDGKQISGTSQSAAVTRLDPATRTGRATAYCNFQLR